MIMEIRQLRYFVTVAEEMHFKNAANRLHIAQPALSQQIRALEKSLGADLFRRTTRRVEMTAAGNALLPAAHHILSQTDAAARLVTQASLGSLGTVRIGFVGSAAIELIPAMRRYMNDQWPNVDVELQETPSDELITALRQRGTDVGVVRETMDYPKGIVIRPLYNEPLVLAVPNSHRFANASEVWLRDLTGETLISFREDTSVGLSARIAQLLYEAEVGYHKGQEAVQFVTMVGLVAARLGVAIVPKAMKYLQLPGVTFVPFADDRAFSTVALAYRQEDEDNLLIQNCVSAAVTTAGGEDISIPPPPVGLV
ncbi:MAG: LysR family transcriptional regulator [Bowdeniella nasicola]|nr:LysR family transcriptional regulator [Bowdeniella nasicola]